MEIIGELKVFLAYLIKIYQKLYVRFVKLFSDKDDAVSGDLLTKTLFNLLVGAFCCGVFLFIVNCFWVQVDESSSGIFGDFFGGMLNPILTFLTFMGLIVTIVIQRQELKLSRVEFEKTSDALTTQSVENTFFNILDLHHAIADNLKIDISAFSASRPDKVGNGIVIAGRLHSSSETVFQGRAAFDEVLKFLSADAASPKQVLERYKIIQDDHNHVLGHYFRNLYQALKVIDNYDEQIVSKGEKYKYASILRAQLSTKELALLFLNCLDNVCDKGQFKNLLIKYAMFEHLPCKLIDGRFQLDGSSRLMVDKSMVCQYKKVKKFATLDLEKTFGGAFGKNKSIPYDLLN
jgi:hypothetical protein